MSKRITAQHIQDKSRLGLVLRTHLSAGTCIEAARILQDVNCNPIDKFIGRHYCIDLERNGVDIAMFAIGNYHDHVMCYGTNGSVPRKLLTKMNAAIPLSVIADIEAKTHPDHIAVLVPLLETLNVLYEKEKTANVLSLLDSIGKTSLRGLPDLAGIIDQNALAGALQGKLSPLGVSVYQEANAIELRVRDIVVGRLADMEHITSPTVYGQEVMTQAVLIGVGYLTGVLNVPERLKEAAVEARKVEEQQRRAYWADIEAQRQREAEAYVGVMDIKAGYVFNIATDTEHWETPVVTMFVANRDMNAQDFVRILDGEDLVSEGVITRMRPVLTVSPSDKRGIQSALDRVNRPDWSRVSDDDAPALSR